VNDIENRLRDAYRGATDTVRPEAIRSLGDHATFVAPSARWWERGALHRLMVPLTAAAAVVVIGVVAAVVVPRALRDARDEARNQRSGVVTRLTGDPATHFLVGLPVSGPASYLSIRSAITGAAMATIAPPPGWFFGPVATTDGRSYVVAVMRTGHCGTWLRRFTISRTGMPTWLAGSEPRHVRWADIEKLAISADGRTIALAGIACPGPGAKVASWPGKAGLGVMVTKQTSKTSFTTTGRFWPVSSGILVNSISLTADGRQLEFSTDLTARFPSDIFVLPTDAPAGIAGEQHSRVIVKAARFGARTAITSSVMTPDGRTIYFTTRQTGREFNGRWALRAIDVPSGRSRLVTERPGFAAHIVVSPSGRELFAFLRAVPTPVAPPPAPSPMPSSSATPTATPSAPSPIPSSSATPTAIPSAPSPIPSSSAAPTAIPSAPSPVPSAVQSAPPSSPVPRSPTGAPSPIPSVSPATVPQAAPTPQAAFGPFAVIRIQLPGGPIRYLDPVPWEVGNFFFVW
jgi:cell division septation protein DedD